MRRFVLGTFLLGAACAGSPTPDDSGAAAAPARISLTIAGPGAVAIPALHSSCHGNCSFAVTPGANIHLEVVGGLKARFAGWSGACAGNGVCEVVAGEELLIGATFHP